MGRAAIDELESAIEALVTAMAGTDAQAIEAATRNVQPIIADIAGQGAWRATPELREVVDRVALALDRARLRAHVNADLARRQLDLLASKGTAVPGAATYRR